MSSPDLMGVPAACPQAACTKSIHEARHVGPSHALYVKITTLSPLDKNCTDLFQWLGLSSIFL